jgi:hypothetical protein
MTMGRLAGLLLTVLCGAAGMTQLPCLPASCEKQGERMISTPDTTAQAQQEPGPAHSVATQAQAERRGAGRKVDDMAEILMSGARA